MSGQATVLSAGGATVPSSGFYTATGIQQVQQLLNTTVSAVVEIYNQNGVPPVPTPAGGAAGNYVLIVPDGTTVPGTLAVPSGYGAVIFGENTAGTVTGGDARTTVLSAGDITYTGAAAEVVATSTISGATGSYNDSAAGAVFDLGGGAYSVTAGGNQQTIQVDSSAAGTTVRAGGNNDTIKLGDAGLAAPSAAVAAALLATTVASGISAAISGRGDQVTVNSFGALIGDTGPGSTTITGVSGSSTIFAAANDVYFGGAAVTEFISSASAQTVFGGTGNDTVFNTSGGSLVYNEGTGTNNIFVAAGTSNTTINGAGAGAVFGGSGRTDLNLGFGNDVFVGGNGGSDSIYGGSVTPTVFGGTNESVNIVGSHAAFELATGSGDTFNASLSQGGNNFFSFSTSGNTTLVGATGSGVDTFNLVSVAGGSAHTLTIQNWHTGDGMFLAGYSAADIATADQAVQGGASTFTLSDGTKVVFQGAHPTAASGSVLF